MIGSLATDLLNSFRQAAAAHGIDAQRLKDADVQACLDSLARLIADELPEDSQSELAAASAEPLVNLQYFHEGLSARQHLLLLKAYRQTFLEFVNTEQNAKRVHTIFDQLDVHLFSTLLDSEQEQQLRLGQWGLTPARRRYLDIFDYIPQPVVLMDVTGKIVHMNKLAQNLFQVTPDEYEGRSAYKVFPWFSDVDIDNLSDRAVLEQVIKLSGSTHYTNMSFAHLQLGSGLKGLIMVVHDLTRLKQAEGMLRVSETRFRQLVEHMSSGVVVCTAEGDGTYIVRDLNGSAERLEGINRQDLIGSPLNALFPHAWQAPLLESFRSVESTGESVRLAIAAPGDPRFARAQEHFIYRLPSREIVDIYDDVTARREAEERLRRTRHRLLDTIEFLPDATFVVNLKGEVTVWNQAMEELTGVPKQEMIGRGEHSYSIPFFGEPRQGMFERIINGAANHTNSAHYDLLQREGDTYYAEVYAPSLHGGRGAYVWAKAKPMYDVEGKVVGVIQSIRDITERRRYREALEVSERRLRHITDNLLDIICETDAKGELLYVSQSTARVLGFQPADMLGTSVFELVHPEDFQKTQQVLHRAQSTPSQGRLEFRCRRSDGSYIWVEAIGNTTYDSQGLLERVILAIRDITSRKSLEDRLRFLGSHDGLTGLYNRSHLQRLMKELDGRHEAHVGLLFCDVDGLKLVNDTMGHEAGDNLLLKLGQIIKRACRPEDVIARIGGDEFAVLLRGVDRQQVDALCGSIRKAVDDYNSATPKLHLSVSIGSAVSDEGYVSMNALFKEADDNMYREKLHRSRSTRSAIVQTLMTALEARDFLTEGHADRMQDQVVGLGRALGLVERELVDLRLLAQFHDIGKVGIPDRILFKPGPLDEAERVEMQRHSEIGHRIAQSSPDLVPIADLILKHHEWWNGQGYPLGLAGTDIPLVCRILAIADAYDAMTSDRPYRAAMPKERALTELRAKAGSQFDPTLVPLFSKLMMEG